MTDYVVSNGAALVYPRNHMGMSINASLATFLIPEDIRVGLSSNVLAIPNLPVSVLSTTPIKVADTFFGCSVQMRSNDSSFGMPFAKTVRTHDLKDGTGMWKYIETSAGVFNWKNIDDWVKEHYAAGRDLIFTVYGTPAFYSARATEQCAYGSSYLGVAAEPSDMTKLTAFINAVATRYAGQIKFYEIWNEPNYNNDGANTPSSPGSFYFSGTFAKLAQMTRLVAQAVKAIDPTAKIISPPLTVWTATGTDTAGTWFTSMMAASDGASGTMKDWIDIIGNHLYLPQPNKVQDLAGQLARIRAAMTSAGVANLELWDTESAPIGPDASSLTDTQFKLLMTRYWFTMAALGVNRTIYYQADHGTMGFINRPEVISHLAYLRDLLTGGKILNATRFTDGRIAYAHDSDLTIL